MGKNLAYAELELILSRFLWRFESTLLDDDFNFERQRAFFVREKPPLRVRLRVRSHSLTENKSELTMDVTMRLSIH